MPSISPGIYFLRNQSLPLPVYLNEEMLSGNFFLEIMFLHIRRSGTLEEEETEMTFSIITESQFAMLSIQIKMR